MNKLKKENPESVLNWSGVLCKYHSSTLNTIW
nr:MAG TPA: hypothetical protein [Inoviridae sp.]